MKDKWTRFMDMSSGGRQKASHAYIIIEAPEDEAKVIFYNRFGHNPERVTCTCCGSDYSIGGHESLADATAYDRGCRFAYFKDGVEVKAERFRSVPGAEGRYVEEADPEYSRDHLTVDAYLKSGKVLVIRAADIKAEERTGEVPEQGYVWQD